MNNKASRPPMPAPPRASSGTVPLPGSVSKIRAALITEAIYNGGAERWIEDLVSSTDPNKVEWIGVGVSEKIVSAVAAERIEARAPLMVGVQECQSLSLAADVLVAWPHLHTFSLPKEKPAIWVSHSGPESKWGVDHARTTRDGFNVEVAVSEEAVRSYNTSKWDSVVVIENGINKDRLTPTTPRHEFCRRYDIPMRSKVVGYLGRVSKEKGYKSLIESAKYMPDSWTIVIGGVDYYQSNVSNIRSHIGANVLHIGEVGDVGSFMGALDVLVVPSDYESFGYSIVEGWACGVPVVSTCVGVVKQHPNLVRLISAPASARAIAMGVIEDMTSHEEVAVRVRNALHVTDSCFSIEEFGRKWTNLLIRSTHKSLPEA